MRDHTRTLVAVAVAAVVVGTLCISCSSDEPDVSLEMRIVQEAPDDALTAMTMKEWGEVSTFYAHDEVLLTEEDVTGAIVVKLKNGAPAMELIMVGEGREKLLEVTRRNVGKRLGIIINGQLQSTSLIEAPIRHGVVTVTGHMLEPAAKRCSRALTREAA